MKSIGEKKSMIIITSLVVLAFLQLVAYYDLSMKIQDSEKRASEQSFQQAVDIQKLQLKIK